MPQQARSTALDREAPRLASGWLDKAPVLALGVALLLYGYCLVRTAWLCDDAYITFRTIGNFISGFGPTWNTAERVQAYTHPLWMLLLSGLFCVTADIYYSTLFVSMALSLAAALVYVFGIARAIPQAILGLTILLFSKAFMDYSTSGLENPLSYLLLALFLRTYLAQEAMTPRRLVKLSLLASLLVLNRMDLLLLVAPALAHALWQISRPLESSPGGKRRSLARDAGLVLLGLVPFFAWEVFSVIYYGFPFPNTAYAKLNTGIPAAALLRQGWYYMVNSLTNDHVTLPAILCAVLAAGISRQGRKIALGVGIVLYLLYTIEIGGDFMSGRFFTLPLLAAVGILGTVRIPGGSATTLRAWHLSRIACLAAVPIVVLLGLTDPRPNLLSNSRCGLNEGDLKDKHGISDERTVYYQSTGLLRGSPNPAIPSNDMAELGATAAQRDMRVLVSSESIGMLGYYAGPNVHIIDVLALPDALLARLPVPSGMAWRIGHFRRFLPDGYSESLRAGRNQLTDLRLRKYYDQLRLVTAGKIFSGPRWKAILDLNLGRSRNLVDTEYYRNPPLRVRMDPNASGQDRNAALLSMPLPSAGVWVHLNEPRHAAGLEIDMDPAHDCRVLYPQGPDEPVEQLVPAQPAGPALRQVHIPPSVSQAGFDRILLMPVPGDTRCWIERVRVIDAVSSQTATP